MTQSGVNITNLPQDTLLDAGVLYVGSTKIGVTRGAPKFDPARTWRNIEFDGKQAPVKGLDRPMYGEATITGTLIEFGGATTGNQIAKLEPGATVVTAGAITTYTPIAGGALLAAVNYYTNLRLFFERAGPGTYAAILFPVAFCRKYDVQGANLNESTIPFEFCARLDLATQLVSDPPYQIELRTSLP
jgi:hypothetical protein